MRIWNEDHAKSDFALWIAAQQNPLRHQPSLMTHPKPLIPPSGAFFRPQESGRRQRTGRSGWSISGSNAGTPASPLARLRQTESAQREREDAAKPRCLWARAAGPCPHPALRATFSRRREKDLVSVCETAGTGSNGVGAAVPAPEQPRHLVSNVEASTSSPLPLAGEGSAQREGGSTAKPRCLWACTAMPCPQPFGPSFSRRGEKEVACVWFVPKLL